MIKNIIFDFGAVLIPIDESKTVKAFEALGANEELLQQKKLFNNFEIGKISSKDFFNSLQPFMFRHVFLGDLRNAWNAMLGELPEENVQLLKRIKKDYRIFLLSNTNVDHIASIKNQAGMFLYGQFEKQFESVHYSHELGMRKPDKKCFVEVLKRNNLKAEETLMIDDKEENIQGAAKAGLKTWHFNPQTDNILQLKKEIKSRLD